MYEGERHKNWSIDYWNHIKRNIGLIKILDQEKLRKTRIAILGVGGLGGSVAEQLIRTGCEQIVICDHDKFEESNLNRQICTKQDIGKLKIDVLETYLKSINPKVNVRKFEKIDNENILTILKDVRIVTLTLDDPIALILIARTCKELEIPMIESYGIPYLHAWWFTKDSIDYETCYNLETHEMSILQIEQSNNIKLKFKQKMLAHLLRFPGIEQTYDREKGALGGMITGKLPLVTLAPIVRITASFIAFEIVFSGILKIKDMILAPSIIGYDYLRMKPIEIKY